jgi:flagellar protein FliO/FliZ
VEDVSVVSLLVRVVVSLGVVLAIMAGAAALLRRGGIGGAPRTGLGRARARATMEVLGRVSLGRNTSVTVVRVGSRALVLGVADQKVTLLTETDPAELAPPPVEDPETPRTAAPGGFPPASSAWKAVVEQLRERTVRR